MTLKSKNDEGDELSEDENSKFKSYITRQFKKFIGNANVKASDKNCKQFSFPKSKSQGDLRKNPKILDKVSTLQLIQSAMVVKGTDK